jgi:hypothetical protein
VSALSTTAGQSTSTHDQQQRILEALRRGPQTTDDLRELGIYQTSARIFGLRKQGHEIIMSRFSGMGRDGFYHRRMGKYTLVREASAKAEMAAETRSRRQQADRSPPACA